MIAALTARRACVFDFFEQRHHRLGWNPTSLKQTTSQRIGSNLGVIFVQTGQGYGAGEVSIIEQMTKLMRNCGGDFLVARQRDEPMRQVYRSLRPRIGGNGVRI